MWSDFRGITTITEDVEVGGNDASSMNKTNHNDEIAEEVDEKKAGG